MNVSQTGPDYYFGDKWNSSNTARNPMKTVQNITFGRLRHGDVSKIIYLTVARETNELQNVYLFNPC